MTTYSVIIPTRDRHETLYHTIRSVLSLEDDDLEVIVSDNCSSEETQETVSKFRDSRLVYSRSPERISMTANFERGMKLSHGDFITILGDDDFIVPSVWKKIKPALAEKSIVSWFRYCYYWPNFPDAPGTLCASLSKNLIEQQSYPTLNLALEQFLNYQFLPSLYNSWVAKSLLDQLVVLNQRMKVSNYIFSDSTLLPDVYSALQLLLVSNQFTFSTLPFSVSGISSFSNGMGAKYKNKDSQSFIKEYGYASTSEAVYPCLSQIIEYLEILEFLNQISMHDIRTSVLILSDYLHFIDKYNSLLADNVSIETILISFLRRIESVYSIPQEVVTEMAEILNLSYDLIQNTKLIEDFHFVSCYNSKPDVFTIDTRQWECENCYDAMLLYEELLSRKQNIG